jgi:hypothetical protein
VAGDDFVLSIRTLPDNGRDKNAVGLDTLNSLFHFLIVLYLERMVGEVMELGEGDVDDCADHIL